MPEDQKTPPPAIHQTAIGDGNVQVVGDNNTVNQTFIQKVFKGINIFIGNVFRGDGETLDQRNRRILLNHVENFWVKGVLEKSLYGEVLIELGMKEEPGAVKTYPWGIKRENTGETLPAGTTMLEIFEQIGLGRSLLVLGAPGSGKTTMLLELARQLIERARQDETEPIPLVFNLFSWTEKQTLAQWLAEQLNLIYYVPRRTAPDWISGNKLLLLLDGLDELRAESRAKCVEAINAFRKEHGLTSLTVCSRSQDYAELKTILAFDGAIDIQPLTLSQVDEYFGRFGKGMTGIRQVLEEDIALREMAGTPLFLSIMTLAYQNKVNVEILASDDVNAYRIYLFNIYIRKMFEQPEHSKSEKFKKQDALHWLSWLARKMTDYNQALYFIEHIQPYWLGQKKQLWWYALLVGLIGGFLTGSLLGLVVGVIEGIHYGLSTGLAFALLFGLLIGFPIVYTGGQIGDIDTVDSLTWNWMEAKNELSLWLPIGLGSGLLFSLIFWSLGWVGAIFGLWIAILCGLLGGLSGGLGVKQLEIMRPGQRISLSLRSYFLSILIFGPFFGLFMGLFGGLFSKLITGFLAGIIFGGFVGLFYGGFTIIQHYALRVVLTRNNLLPWKLIPFLDYCCDLIFLRRVGGGYIFVHRLLMEHFAAMYQEKQ